MHALALAAVVLVAAGAAPPKDLFAPRWKSTRLKDGAVEHALPRGPVESAGLDSAALGALLAEAERQLSSAVVIVKDGKLVVEKYREGFDGGPAVVMSVSKAVVALAAGLLAHGGKLTLDTRVSALLPEWKDTPRATITLRQLLNHTSGLDPTRADFTRQSIRDRAAATAVASSPGAKFFYNNNAVDIAGLALERAAGKKLDAYLDEALWGPLDAVDPSWLKDKDGTPRGADALFIRPVDLAKVGQLMLERGKWNGAELLAPEWISEVVARAQPFTDESGLCWWREGSWGYSARGWLGQTLVVFPEARLVAVRMRIHEQDDYADPDAENNAYKTFAKDVRALVKRK